jgi:dTDP-glucose 4,6-dehydratase
MAQKELGYVPQCTFEESLGDIIDWYAKNEKWWKPLKNK